MGTEADGFSDTELAANRRQPMEADCDDHEYHEWKLVKSLGLSWTI
jgi:hypothetical protein